MSQRLSEHSGTAPKRLRRVSAIVIIALLCAGGTFTATPASAATWIGTVHGTSTRSTPLVSGGFSWQGSFSFTVNRNGAVDGRATVAYQPLVDVTVLNGAVTYVRDVATDAISSLLPGGWGVGVNAFGPRAIVGAYVRFRESTAVRGGPISGRLNRRDGTLTLKWDNVAGSNTKFDTYLRLVAASRRISSDVAKLPDPFKKSPVARLIGPHAQSYPPRPSEKNPRGIDSYWVADRVS
jgi:hypothetical protein